MWSSSLVPKTGQIIKKSSTYQMVIKKSVALGCIGKMHIVALKVPFHKANERGCRHPESINRSTVKARFRRPKQHGYITHMVSKSRFSRRLHRIKEIFIVFFNLLAQTWKTLNTDAIYVIDSIPVAVCDNIRIRRSKIYSKEDFRGYQASKKR